MAFVREGDPEAALDRLSDFMLAGERIKLVTKTALPSAAAGVFRLLSQESADDQYEWLSKWTLPTESRRNVRLLATPVPTDAPPKAFARELGERPRDSSFPIASVGSMNAFFCSGWMLVEAADEVGRLSRLRSELEELTKQNVQGARELFVLSHLTGGRGDVDLAETFFRDYIEQSAAEPVVDRDLIIAAIACAALDTPELQASAETVLQSLVDRSGVEDVILLRPFFRCAHATAVQVHRGTSSPERAFENRLKYWVPATVRTAWDMERGHRDAIWLTHEHHLLHLAGGSSDLLFCRFPLTGDFDFICHTQEGGGIGTDGGLAYGGLQFQALGRTDMLTIWDADGRQSAQRFSPFARTDSKPTFNRVSIRSRYGKPAFESNLHPVWIDDARAYQSPWLALRSSGTKRPVFRGLELTEYGEIPERVRLVEGDHLRGWQAGFFGESIPAFDASAIFDGNAVDGANADWQQAAGELTSIVSEDPNRQRQPSLLRYQRPLLAEESITYEFKHDDESRIVHPALGRIVFLLDPAGMRVRWITTGEADWTGLAPDNAILEPLYRKGPRTLPLAEGGWNTVTVSRSAETVSIALNGELVYARPIEGDSVEQFGFYRPSREATVRIRNVVMTGDWPEEVPAEFLKSPTAQFERE